MPAEFRYVIDQRRKEIEAEQERLIEEPRKNFHEEAKRAGFKQKQVEFLWELYLQASKKSERGRSG